MEAELMRHHAIPRIATALATLLIASAASGHDHDVLRAAYESVRVPVLGDALRRAAALPPFHIRAQPGEALAQGEQVKLTLSLFVEPSRRAEHQEAMELAQLFAQEPWSPGEPTHALTPVQITAQGVTRGFLLDPRTLRAAGLHEARPAELMRVTVPLRLTWRDGEGATLAVQLHNVAVSPSCEGLPLRGVSGDAAQGLELGSRLHKINGERGERVEVSGCMMQLEVTLPAASWASSAQIEVELALDGIPQERQPPHLAGAWQRLLPPQATRGVCALERKAKGKAEQLASWSYDAGGRPVEQRGWGTSSGQRRFVYAKEQLIEVWDGKDEVERVVYGSGGQLLGTWRARRSCTQERCEEELIERSVWVTLPDGSEQRLVTTQGRWPFEPASQAQAQARASYVLERRAGEWEAVSATGGAIEHVHEVLLRDILERDSFVQLTAHEDTARLRVQIERWHKSAAGTLSFEALLSAHDAADRPLAGLYVEHAGGKSRAVRVSHDLNSCHKRTP
jgi:hypothetical protein